MQSASFNHFHVIESLPENDSQTGTKLVNSVASSKFHQSGFSHDLTTVISRADLINCLTKIAEKSERQGLCPALHFESHGLADGLRTAAGDFISWQELKPMLIRINVATRNNLLVTLACCHGAHLARVISPTDRSPCWGLAGPVGSVTSLNLLIAFRTFYHHVLENQDGSAAIAALNDDSEGAPQLYFTSSQDFFVTCYKKYISQFCNRKSLRERARDMIRRHDLQLNEGTIASEMKRRIPTDFKRHKARFFMYDLAAENRQRFKIDWENIICPGS